MLFQEAGPLPERYAAAAAAGFTAVEAANIYDFEAEQLAAAKKAAGLEQTLINGYYGGKGDFGLAALPSRVKDFHQSLEISIKYAKALNCKRIHILSGCRPNSWHDNAMDETYLENLKYAADRLLKENIIGLIEPINSFITIKNYYMDCPHRAAEMVRKINHPNIRLQLDIYHLQLTAGSLTKNIRDMLPLTEYIQIAQAPDRHEPESPGEINYDYVFKVLKQENYSGVIGLEFIPSTETTSCIQWTMKYA